MKISKFVLLLLWDLNEEPGQLVLGHAVAEGVVHDHGVDVRERWGK